MSHRRPPWWVDGSVQETVNQATDAGVDVDTIVEFLDELVFEDVTRDRIETVIRRIQSRSVEDVDVTLSQSPSSDDDPRVWPDRYVDSSDIQYLSDREFARVLGLVFEGFQGATVRPATNDAVEPNLYWNRSHRTLAFRTVTRPSEVEVDADAVAELLEGESQMEGNRAPSDHYVVTNTSFTPEAESRAADTDVVLVDRGRLEEWLRLARLDMETVGAVLEAGESHDGALTELLDDNRVEIGWQDDPLATVPTSKFVVESTRQSTASTESPTSPGSPVSTGASGSGSSSEDSPSQTASKSVNRSERSTGSTVDNGPLTADDSPDPGEHGKLYADSEKDGEYEAFDAVLDELDDQT